jgi:hypothetical protein
MNPGLYKQKIRHSVTDTENEAWLEQKLRQIALEIFYAPSGINTPLKPRFTVLQEMNKAILAAYIEKYSNPPSAIEIQHMRRYVLKILDDIDKIDTMHDILP